MKILSVHLTASTASNAQVVNANVRFFSRPFNGSSYALEQVAEALESFHEPLDRIS